MKKVVINIGGMSCSACSNRIEKHLSTKKHILDATVNLVLAQANITYDDSKINMKDIAKYIEESGYTYEGIFKEQDLIKKEKKNFNILIIMSILACLVMYISMGMMIGLKVPSIFDMEKEPINYLVLMFILTIIFLIYGSNILKDGLKNLINRHPNMYSLVSIGVLASLVYSIYNSVHILNGNHMLIHDLYLETVCIVIYFVKLGKLIESRAKEHTKDALKELVTITPEKALLLKNGKTIETTIDEIKLGDILLVKPGMKVAVDGKIIKGSSHFDESFITGESKPSKKSINDNIVAGSINLDGVVEYEAERIGPKSTISEIVHLVIDASNTKASVERIVDKVSSIFVPLILLIGILTLIGYLISGEGISSSIKPFITVLVVACPCALGLATPLAIVVSEGLFARKGILIKNASTIEETAKIDIILFDKTGTLTNGKLTISKIYNFTKEKDDDLLNIVANLEEDSTHPISNAFKLFKKTDIFVNNFKNISGVGITGKINKDIYYVTNARIFEKLKINNDYEKQEFDLSNKGNSICYLIKNNKVLALIGIKDELRDKSKMLISKLKKMNKHIIMITGDNEITANIIAKELKIDEVYSSVLPKDKTNIVNDLIKNNHKVMMIGDGINDAPALVSANVGVSISSGTDIAASSSDIVLLNDDLEKIIDILRIGKSTMSKIKQNLFWAFFYNIIMIPIAIGLFKNKGIELNPMLASLAMMLSSLTVIINTIILNIKEKNYERNNN